MLKYAQFLLVYASGLVDLQRLLRAGKKRRPKSASSTRSRLQMQRSRSHSVVSNTSYRKYVNNTINGDDLESELGDSASVVAERLSRSRSESCVSSSRYSVKSIKTKRSLKKIPTRSELLKTEKKLNKKTIMAAIAAASHYRAIRELAHRKRPMSALHCVVLHPQKASSDQRKGIGVILKWLIKILKN